MTQLPSKLLIQVTPGFHKDVRVSELLVSLLIRYQGRTYYSTLLGLTDAAGRLEVSGDVIARDYRESQRQFPMDYRLTIAQCDPTAVVGIGGGPDFSARRTAALESAMISEPYRRWWAAARDEEVAADQTAITLDGAAAEARLTARRVGVP
jgi:hypothetical protein